MASSAYAIVTATVAAALAAVAVGCFWFRA